jgi:hypothetical protein
MSGLLGEQLLKTLLEGGVYALRGKALVVKRTGLNEINVLIHDENGQVLVDLARVNIGVGDSLTVLNMDLAFNIHIDGGTSR